MWIEMCALWSVAYGCSASDFELRVSVLVEGRTMNSFQLFSHVLSSFTLKCDYQ